MTAGSLQFLRRTRTVTAIGAIDRMVASSIRINSFFAHASG